MTRRNLLICSFSIGTLLAQSAPQAQQATDFKGVVRKNLAPISSEVLRVKFPKPAESKLKNGMSLLVLEDHRSPTIQVRIAMPASNLNDPRELAGLGDAATALLRLGTKTRTSVQIANTLQELGASFNANIGERANISFSTLSENLDPVLDLVSDIMFNPAFPSGRAGQMEEPPVEPTHSDSDATRVPRAGTLFRGDLPQRQPLRCGAFTRVHQQDYPGNDR